MSQINVSAKDPQTEKVITVAYDFGSTLEEAVALFGADVVLAGFIADAKVGLQAAIRGKMRAKKEDETPYTDEEIVAHASAWKPGNKSRTTADPMEKLTALLGKLTPEQKAALMATL